MSTVRDKATGIRITDHTGKASRAALLARLAWRVEQLKDHAPWKRQREREDQGVLYEPIYGLVLPEEAGDPVSQKGTRRRRERNETSETRATVLHE